MNAPLPQFLTVNGLDIALRRREGRTPGIVWLGGYYSDMLGSKAQWLDQWADKYGAAFLRHDYSGHGESGGEFRDGTISDSDEPLLDGVEAIPRGERMSGRFFPLLYAE